MEQQINRRSFVIAGTVAAMGAAGMANIGQARAEESEDIEAPEFPFVWHKLDIDEVQKAAYDGFYNLGGCARTVFNAILGTMAQEYGYPYNQIPTEMYYNGHAGYTVASLCGTLGGAAGILGLFLSCEDSDALLTELESWYSASEFPEYQPDMELVTTVSDSVNCIDSVGTWMAAADVAERSDPKRQARCAGLSADVAKKVCEMLDEYYGLAEAEVGATGTHEA